MDVEKQWVEGIVREAAAVFRKGFFDEEKKTNVAFKLSASDLLTKTDLAVENFLKAKISSQFPQHKFLCEESSKQHSTLSKDPTWVIDPIDGTANFVHSLPNCTISVGYVVDLIPVIGVVYNPITDEMFSAEKGKGASLNGSPLRTSGCSEAAEALVDTGFSVGSVKKLTSPDIEPDLRAQLIELKGAVLENLEQLLLRTRDVRRTGACSIGMASVARGHVDVLAELSVKEWDVAASILIVEEAGGYCCQYGGEAMGDMHGRSVIAASTKELALEISSFLQRPSFPLSLID